MVKAYILINVKGGTEYELYEKLMDLPGLIEIALVWGLFDLILQVEADNSKALNKLVTEKIRKFQNISNTITMFIQETGE
ncbi:Lrp/AsnC family transcriptional regulator [Candidatus Heimdallarchaeota archaeon]|nr:MAG: Lrp/AsnC family transcriptional regulator [Candidatus Heimdallarchaeota archaeon]